MYETDTNYIYEDISKNKDMLHFSEVLRCNKQKSNW